MNSGSIGLAPTFRLMAAGWWVLSLVVLCSTVIPVLPRFAWSAWIYAACVVGFSLVAVLLYGVDKLKAARGWWRISERTLHVCAVLGGWPGAVWGQYLFRHKTQKLTFRAVFWVTLAAHFACVCLLVYFGWLALFPTAG